MGTYRTQQTYQSNYERGPDFSGPYPDVPACRGADLFGRPVNSRIGIAAGLLLNSKWITVYAKLGYDILTYKTVRSRHRECYPPPNWVQLDVGDRLPDDADVPLMAAPAPDGSADATWGVCFGMPSMAPDVWRADVERAKAAMGHGQLLNVSVVGTPDDSDDMTALADDFARCAGWARESGADLIEANFSCPNVCSKEGQIYQDAAVAHATAQRIRRAIGDSPLLIKTGYFRDFGGLDEFLRAMDGLADAIVLVNAIQRRVHDQSGRSVFGPFEKVGIVGHAIRNESLRLVADAAAIVRRRKLRLHIFGVGGIAAAHDALAYLRNGADAIFLGSAPMTRPALAVEIKNALTTA